MRTNVNLSPLADVCTTIANEVADSYGFVRMGSLLSRFDVKLVIRPLLVEGMLAKIPGERDGSTEWAVLVDQEQHPYSVSQVVGETPQAPLPARMRFTIAHELAHSLAYRPTQFGMELQYKPNDKQSYSAFVRAVEGETDKLTSLLLWAESSVAAFLKEKVQPLTVDRLSRLTQEKGISRFALLSRLRSFQMHDRQGLLQRKALRNVGIGIGSWVQRGQAVLRKWPVFLNFDRNIVPAPLLKALAQDKLPAQSVFPDPEFVLSGGTSRTMRFVCDAGIPSTLDAEKMHVEVSVEEIDPRPGAAFFYVIVKDSGTPRSEESSIRPPT